MRADARRAYDSAVTTCPAYLADVRFLRTGVHPGYGSFAPQGRLVDLLGCDGGLWLPAPKLGAASRWAAHARFPSAGSPLGPTVPPPDHWVLGGVQR